MAMKNPLTGTPYGWIYELNAEGRKGSMVTATVFDKDGTQLAATLRELANQVLLGATLVSKVTIVSDRSGRNTTETYEKHQ